MVLVLLLALILISVVAISYIEDAFEKTLDKKFDARRINSSIQSERWAFTAHTHTRRSPMDRPGPNWFSASYAEAMFTQYLTPYAGQEKFRALQIGAYCGDASEWLIKYILTGTGASLIDVDTWKGSDEPVHHNIDWNKVRDFYIQRMLPYHNHGVFVGTSDEYFDTHPKPFDFIYVDGSHKPDQVLRDAVHADQFLKIGGIIAFDDYRWSDGSRDLPAPAIDAFLRCYEESYEVLDASLQVWVRKVR